MTAVTVDIVAALPGRVDVTAGELLPGDAVHDAYGRTHTLTRVRIHRRVVTTVRDDGWRDTWPVGERVTVVRRTS